MTQFHEIYIAYGQPVYRFLLRLSGDPDLAEDLLQETFYQALIHIGQFQGRSSLYTWLCQIGKNAWLKECRRRAKSADILPEELPIADPRPGPEEIVVEQDQLRMIRQAILKLSDPYKEVFILHIFGELKLKEIAEAHGKSESWARVTYHRARIQIAKEVMK